MSGSRSSSKPARRRLYWLAGGFAALAVILAIAGRMLLRPAPAPSLTFTLQGPAGTQVPPGQFVVSPDGNQIVMVAQRRGLSMLWLRAISSLDAQPIAGTEGASVPFWSPDGRSLGFFSGDKLKRISVGGGPSVDLCDVPIPRGGTWGAHDDIVFATVAGPLQRVRSTGGPCTPTTTLDQARGDVAHVRPHFLPDGRHVLFVALGTTRELRVASLDGTTADSLKQVRVDSAAMFASGHLLFVRDSRLLAQPFDPRTREIAGEPVAIGNPMTAAVSIDDARPLFSVSATGDVLAYERSERRLSKLTWLDRSGRVVGTVGEPDLYNFLALSPDGERIAASITERTTQKASIWVLGATTGVQQRLTLGPGSDSLLRWSAKGATLVSTRSGMAPLTCSHKRFRALGDQKAFSLSRVSVTG